MKPYEETMTIERLRIEIRELWDRDAAIIKAFKDLPNQPPYEVQLFLGECAKWPDDKNLGNQERQRFGIDAVYPKSEIECGAGLWSRIRDCLREARSK